MKLRFLVVCLACALGACGGKRPAHSASGRGVIVSDDAPPADYVRLGEVSVKSGEGCGVLGTSGSREDAQLRLKDEAHKLGGSYVQVTSYESPRPNHQCLEHEHKLSGIVYRAAATVPPAPLAPAADPPPPASALPASPAPLASVDTPPTPSRVCVPGATQACLGPGACQGAQACRDDASGYLPCDCGPTLR